MVSDANSCKIAVSHVTCYYESSFSDYAKLSITIKKKALSTTRTKIEGLTSDLTSRCDFPVILLQKEPNSQDIFSK